MGWERDTIIGMAIGAMAMAVAVWPAVAALKSSPAPVSITPTPSDPGGYNIKQQGDLTLMLPQPCAEAYDIVVAQGITEAREYAGKGWRPFGAAVIVSAYGTASGHRIYLSRFKPCSP